MRRRKYVNAGQFGSWLLQAKVAERSFPSDRDFVHICFCTRLDFMFSGEKKAYQLFL